MHSTCVTRTIFFISEYLFLNSYFSKFFSKVFSCSRYYVWGGTCLKCLNGTTPLCLRAPMRMSGQHRRKLGLKDGGGTFFPLPFPSPFLPVLPLPSPFPLPFSPHILPSSLPFCTPHFSLSNMRVRTIFNILYCCK